MRWASTRDSITVAPAQTLTGREYQAMRDASIAILRRSASRLRLQRPVAIDPRTAGCRVEMNPRCRARPTRVQGDRLSIAKIAAKLAVGYTLDESATISPARHPRASSRVSTTPSSSTAVAFEKFRGTDETSPRA